MQPLLRKLSSEHRDVAQSGSATVWGTGGRKFESCHPDEESARALFLYQYLLFAFRCFLLNLRLQRYTFFLTYTIEITTFLFQSIFPKVVRFFLISHLTIYTCFGQFFVLLYKPIIDPLQTRYRLVYVPIKTLSKCSSISVGWYAKNETLS